MECSCSCGRHKSKAISCSLAQSVFFSSLHFILAFFFSPWFGWCFFCMCRVSGFLLPQFSPPLAHHSMLSMFFASFFIIGNEVLQLIHFEFKNVLPVFSNTKRTYNIYMMSRARKKKRGPFIIMAAVVVVVLLFFFLQTKSTHATFYTHGIHSALKTN